MSKRTPVTVNGPEALKAMLALESYARTMQVGPTLKNLIKIRASQINKCVNCLDMHTEEALNQGGIYKMLTSF